jgi:methenyltetrahydromethanopterin cyclohydrolase
MDTATVDLKMNARALRIAEECRQRADELRVRATRLRNGTQVLDAGIEAEGGLDAGLALAHMCLGGLGRVELVPWVVDEVRWHGVQVRTDHPAAACMAAQYAGWAISAGNYFAMASGPLRARARVEKELFAKLPFVEDGDAGVLVLEGRTLPDEAVADWIADKAGIRAENLTLAIAPTASLAGGVQVVARVIETGLHKMDAVGFDITRVISAIGTAPNPPVANNDLRAIGRTNDCVLYGGHALYTVRADDAALSALAARLPSSSSEDYGTPFYDIFKRYNNDFYKIDPLLFSPAMVSLTSAETGRTFTAGSLNVGVLVSSLMES